VVGDDQAQNRVPQELESLVRLEPGVLGDPGAVGQRQGQVSVVAEQIPEASMQLIESGDRKRRRQLSFPST
jgi:hypothetical protein